MQTSNPNLKNSLQKISKGLNEANPFNDTHGVDIILKEAEKCFLQIWSSWHKECRENLGFYVEVCPAGLLK